MTDVARNEDHGAGREVDVECVEFVDTFHGAKLYREKEWSSPGRNEREPLENPRFFLSHEKAPKIPKKSYGAVFTIREEQKFKNEASMIPTMIIMSCLLYGMIRSGVSIWNIVFGAVSVLIAHFVFVMVNNAIADKQVRNIETWTYKNQFEPLKVGPLMEIPAFYAAELLDPYHYGHPLTSKKVLKVLISKGNSGQSVEEMNAWTKHVSHIFRWDRDYPIDLIPSMAAGAGIVAETVEKLKIEGIRSDHEIKTVVEQEIEEDLAKQLREDIENDSTAVTTGALMYLTGRSH